MILLEDRATKYAEKVATGDIVAGTPHKQACIRHLEDLERQGTKEFPYIWKPEKSQDIIDFAETLTIAEGESPKPVRLYESQCFDLGVPMGWVNDEGYRRFRRSYESMARQNGKSFKNGIRGTYFSAFGGYNYGKLFTAATKKRQSRIAWEEMAKFIRIDKQLGEFFKVQDYKSLITALNTQCTIEALSKEGGLDDGFRSIFNSIDEIHQHRDNSIYKALYTGTRTLKETLNSMITTRGKDLNSFCFEMDKYCLNILNGSVSAEDFFVDIYTLDKNDDYFDEKVWIKANPILCASDFGIETQRRDAQTAKDMGGSDLSDYIVKCCNVWYRDADNQFIDPDAFAECACDLTLEDFKGCECTVGLDLSSGGDLTTLSLEFDGKNDEFYFYSHSFMPRGRFEDHIKTDIAPYDVWEKQELITITGSESDYKNDYKFIIKRLSELKQSYNLKFKGIACDPHNIDGILSDLENFGVPVVMITQSCKQLHEATTDIQLLVKSRKMKYDRKNELLSWSFLNAVTVANSFDEIKVDKEVNKRTRRIDPVDACVDARCLVLSQKGKPEFDVNASMEEYFKLMGIKG